MKRLLGFTSLFLFSCLSFINVRAASSVSVVTDATPREGYIGDPIAYHVTITVSSDVMVAPFTLPVPFGDFETLKVSSPTAYSDPSTGRISVRLDGFITTYTTGTVTIPALTIPFASVSASSGALTTEAIQIHIRSLLAEKGDEGHLRPLKGLFTFRSYAWVWWLLGILMAGALGYFVWKKRSDQFVIKGVKAGPRKPPEQTAWEALHALEDSDLLATGQHKEFYFRLSVILRQYLEDRFGMSALDKTSSELLVEFRKVELASELTSILRNFFDNADLVKFAKLIPAESEIIDDINRVKQFINATTQKKESAPNKEEALPL